MRAPFLSVVALAAALPALAAALPALAAEGGPIRGGEHDGFTRIVLEVEPATEWSLESRDGRAVVTFPGRSIDFTTDGAFDRIPRSRITAIDVGTGRGGSVVALTLGCDCRVSTSFVGARFLAIDIADRVEPTPIGKAAPDEALPVGEAKTLADAEHALVRQITRAANQGIVRYSDDARPKAPERPETGPNPGRPLARPGPTRGTDERLSRTSLPPAGEAQLTIADLLRHEQVSASTVFDRDSRQARRHPPVKPVPGVCLADRALDVTRWSDGTPFAEQLIRFRTRLLGEFDQPDTGAVDGAARLYVRFGLGAEAVALLAAFPDAPIADRAILVDLARAVDDEPVAPTGPLAVDAECPGLHGVWLAAGGAVPVWRTAGGFDAMQAAFAEMPTELRGLLAPRLVRRLIDAGRIDEARLIYLIATRSGEAPGPGLQLAEARLTAAEGRSAEAVRTMAKLARSNEAAISVDALADLVRVALDAHLAIPELVATDLATATLESRGSERDAKLRGLLAETLAQRGDLTGALAELRRARTDLPSQAAGFGALAVRLIGDADPATIGDAVYAEAALGAEDLIAAAPANDPARAAIAGRLVDLGLPDPALRIIAPGLDAGHEAARIVAARAEIARGDGAAARAALGPLASTAAIELRAEAYARSGDYGEALATLDAAGIDATAAGYAWASGDWAKAEGAADADRAAMARYMAARAGDAPAPAAVDDPTGRDPAGLDAGAAFAAPLPPLGRPSLGAARSLLATGGKISGFVESAIAEP